MVVKNFIEVGVIGEYAFTGFVDNIVVNIGIVDVIEHDTLVTAAHGDIAIHFKTL